jgi:hypothetical protein
LCENECQRSLFRYRCQGLSRRPLQFHITKLIRELTYTQGRRRFTECRALFREDLNNLEHFGRYLFSAMSLKQRTYLEILLVPSRELAQKTNQDLTIHLFGSFLFCPLDHFFCSFQSDFPCSIRELSVEVGRYKIGSLCQSVVG